MAGGRYDMRDAEWNILQQVLPSGRQGPERLHDRRVMNGIIYVLRTGIPWRDLPKRYGPYTTCYNRYNRWSRNGDWSAILERLQGLVDENDDRGGDSANSLKTRMIDSSARRAHLLAARSLRDGESL